MPVAGDQRQALALVHQKKIIFPKGLRLFIMKQMRKAYYLFFYKLYTLFKSFSKDGWEEWKAGLVIQTLQYFVLYIIILKIEMILRNSVIPNINPIIWELTLAATIAIFNYYIFLYKKKWKIYETEFNKYSKTQNTIINLIVFCIVIGVCAILIYTFYEYSQIEWNK